ncbi:hypothetical protein CUMW_018700 [Citrus unshiu]|nr:hypothetical protein CUMW_018700 [Citrus unshiu]
MIFPSLIDGLARTVSIKRGKNCRNDSGREAAEALAKSARKNELMLSSSGIVKSNKSSNFASVCSKRGQKGINQDCAIVWEEFGCQEDMVFCGIFDGHGPWGHVVAKRVRESVPYSLLCNWQETLLSSTSPAMNLDLDGNRNVPQYDIWNQSCLKTYAAIDQELKQHTGIDSFRSGTTALTIVKQGESLVVANVGDSRAVLATLSDDGDLVPFQLTVWDVISNQEAVEIVSSIVDREKAAKRLVECAVRAWKYKKRGIAMDDISAICLFFHSSSSRQNVEHNLKDSKLQAGI